MRKQNFVSKKVDRNQIKRDCLLVSEYRVSPWKFCFLEIILCELVCDCVCIANTIHSFSEFYFFVSILKSTKKISKRFFFSFEKVYMNFVYSVIEHRFAISNHAIIFHLTNTRNITQSDFRLERNRKKEEKNTHLISFFFKFVCVFVCVRDIRNSSCKTVNWLLNCAKVPIWSACKCNYIRCWMQSMQGYSQNGSTTIVRYSSWYFIWVSTIVQSSCSSNSSGINLTIHFLGTSTTFLGRSTKGSK